MFAILVLCSTTEICFKRDGIVFFFCCCCLFLLCAVGFSLFCKIKKIIRFDVQCTHIPSQHDVYRKQSRWYCIREFPVFTWSSAVALPAYYMSPRIIYRFLLPIVDWRRWVPIKAVSCIPLLSILPVKSGCDPRFTSRGHGQLTLGGLCCGVLEGITPA